jgi:uncharacterized membrane protein YdjX (TVP38/TMEM64 family)
LPPARKALLAVAVVALLAGATWWLRASGLAAALAEPDVLGQRIAALGAWGPLMLIALMTVAIVLSPIPSAPIALAAGFAYGHGWGTLYVIAGAELGALIAFAIARVLGYDVLRRFLGERLEAGWLGSQNKLTAIVLVARLLPFVSFDLVSYAAGLTALKAWRFALATLIGLLPASFALAHIGGEMATGEAGRIALAALVLGLVTGVPLVLRWIARRHRGR